METIIKDFSVSEILAIRRKYNVGPGTPRATRRPKSAKLPKLKQTGRRTHDVPGRESESLSLRTESEKEIIKGLVDGESIPLIASRLEYAGSGVSMSLIRMRKRFNAITNEHLVAILFRLRIVD